MPLFGRGKKQLPVNTSGSIPQWPSVNPVITHAKTTVSHWARPTSGPSPETTQPAEIGVWHNVHSNQNYPGWRIGLVEFDPQARVTRPVADAPGHPLDDTTLDANGLQLPAEFGASRSISRKELDVALGRMLYPVEVKLSPKNQQRFHGFGEYQDFGSSSPDEAPHVGNLDDSYKGTETFEEVFPRLDNKIGSPLDTRGSAADGVYYAEPRTGKSSLGGQAMVAALAASRESTGQRVASTQGISAKRTSDFDTGFVPRSSGRGRTHIAAEDPRDFGDDYLQP